MSKSFLFFIIAFLLIAVYGIVNYYIISKKEKLFTIGRVYNISEMGKNGRTYFFEYSVKGVLYKGKTSGYGFNINADKLLYVQVLKENANEYSVFEFKKVPHCFTMESVSFEGWKELPKDSCK
jgi:hypothetical protein